MIAPGNETAQLSDEAIRGQLAFDRHVRPQLHPEDAGKFVAIDIQSGDYEVDEDDFEASERLIARCPDARIWLFHAGSPTAYQMQGQRSPGGAR